MITKYILVLLLLMLNAGSHCMEQTIISDNKDIEWLAIPEDIWIHIIACCEDKDALSYTCKYFHIFVSKNKERILNHPSLVLSKEGLETLFLYYGALGNKAIVHNLLLKGANPNACDEKNMSVMHYAAQYGRVDIVDILLQQPTLITADIAKGAQSPLYGAIQCDQNTVVKHIVSACATLHKEDILCYAARQGSLNTVSTLLACSIDVNSLDSIGHYPLHWAAMEGHTHVAKFLIANGALVECRSTNNNNIDSVPLHFAAYTGHANMVQLLIENGTDVNIKTTPDDLTPLHVASQKGHVPIIEILLKNNAHISDRTNFGFTPLHQASSYGQVHAIDILLKNNADVKAQSNLGKTPLHLASRYEHVQAIEILLKNNAHINAQSDCGRTPLDWARSYAIEKLLVTHGAKTRDELKQLKKDTTH